MDRREEYFQIAIADYLQEYSDARVMSFGEIVEYYQGFTVGSLTINAGLGPLRRALQTLEELGALEEIEDEYAGSHYLISPASRKLVLGLLETKNKRYSVYKMMGDEAGDWLGRAFVGIEDKV